MKENSEAFDGVGLAAEPAVAIFAAIEIVRSEDDEAALGQARGEIVIVGVDRLRSASLGHAVAPVLADDDRPAFAGFQILRHQQDAPGEHVRTNVEHHIIAGPLLGVVDLARARIEWRDSGSSNCAKDFFRKVLAVRFGAFDELVRGNRLKTEFPGPSFVCQFGRDLVQEETVADMRRTRGPVPGHDVRGP